MVRTAALALWLISSPVSVYATPIPTEKVGGWNLYVHTDTMTDKKVCVAEPATNPNVQFADNSITVTYTGRGGLQGFYYRIGEEPVSPIQILQLWRPSNSDILVLSDQAFVTRVLQAGHLRIRALTYISSMLDDDIDLKDIPAVQEAMRRSGCP